MSQIFSSNIKIGDIEIPRLGLGCMGLTQAYTPVDHDKAKAFLDRVMTDGPVMLDTAATYSGGKNERLIGSVIKPFRSQVFLASKAGMYKRSDGTREIDGNPDRIKISCDESLARLGIDQIDLFYLHRVDPMVPVEESVGAINDLKLAGKVRAIGLSEISASTLKRAMSVTQIDAVQSEYSLWSRRVEERISAACVELGIALIAYSPVGRGFLAGGVPNLDGLSSKDIRKQMPRFQGANFESNLETLLELEVQAMEWGYSLAQLSLNWLWSQGAHIGAIPGTSQLANWQDNKRAQNTLDAGQLHLIERILRNKPFQGERYEPEKLKQLDSEI